MGCDFISVAAACRALRFQSTHPSGVRRLRSPVAVCFTYFNPRTPVGCDVLVDPQHGCDHISIHAPQWGATSVPSGQGGGSIFQSTHPSGVRPGTFSTQVLQYDFNPRTPVGCDIPTIEFFAHEIISIHAPQWGATRREWSRQSLHKFQSTHPSGVRPEIRPTTRQRRVFQSTHPSGVRPARPTYPTTLPTFQSTHPSGVRLAEIRRKKTGKKISIHAPQWGATAFTVA